MKGGVYRMLTLIPCRHDMNFFFVLKIVTYNYAGIQCKTSAIQ